MASKARAQKVAKRILEELSILLLREVDDPRLQAISITGVEVDREMAYATIFVSSLSTTPEEIDEILSALNGARGYLRRMLASQIELRTFPQLRFQFDTTYDRGARVDELLAELNKESGGIQEETS
jgi:ribosome-binding factor A